MNNWDEFADQAKNLYDSNPIGCRITMKYRHKDGKLIVKVTDNKKVFQYLVEQPKEVKNVDRFISIVMRSMVI